MGVPEHEWDAAFAWADDDDAPADHEQASGPAGPFKVWRGNWPALLCFLACSTQWRVGAMGGVLGLDYPAVEVVMRHRKVTDTTAMFNQLQAMEQGVLEVLRHD